MAARPKSAVPLVEVPAEAPGPDDDAALREVRAAVDEEVNALPAEYRLPVVLCCLEGLSLEEAAGTLGISRATASRHWTYARAWLHDAMSADE